MHVWKKKSSILHTSDCQEAGELKEGESPGFLTNSGPVSQPIGENEIRIRGQTLHEGVKQEGRESKCEKDTGQQNVHFWQGANQDSHSEC